MVKSGSVTNLWKKITVYFRRAFFAVLLAAVLLIGMGASSIPAASDTSDAARAYTRSIEFDYVGWTFNALWVKFLDFSIGAGSFLPEKQRHDLVLEYLDLIGKIQEAQWQIRMVYADPNISDPQEYSDPYRVNLAALTQRRDQIGPVAEAILQTQINAVVSDMGLDLGGQAIPPVEYHSTPLPMALIISPRNTIRQDADISLLPDLPLDQQIALEGRVDSSLDVSSLVVDIGGVGVYPTMVMQTNDINWLSEVVSHEWTHNFLTWHPLGFNYMKSPELRIINETVASISGKEIGREMLERYYPELVPPPPTPAPPAPELKPSTPPQPPAFDFQKEMHATRVKVDELLTEGKVPDAEAYMEAQRKVFWDHGYKGLRKLNQAYFAFYGAYADIPEGAAGEDPVGAAVRQLRAQSPTLADFLLRVSSVTDFAQLQQMIPSSN